MSSQSSHSDVKHLAMHVANLLVSKHTINMLFLSKIDAYEFTKKVQRYMVAKNVVTTFENTDPMRLNLQDNSGTLTVFTAKLSGILIHSANLTKTQLFFCSSLVNNWFEIYYYFTTSKEVLLFDEFDLLVPATKITCMD